VSERVSSVPLRLEGHEGTELEGEVEPQDKAFRVWV
jgi:hypothetical protein